MILPKHPRAALALLVVALTIPGASTASGGTDRVIRSGSWRADPYREADRSVLSEPVTVERFLAFRRAALSRSLNGGQGFILPSVLAEQRPAAAENGGGDPSGYEIPVPVGDLDGDGKDDVLVFGFDFSFEARAVPATPADHFQVNVFVRALAGTDGHELWRMGLGYDDALMAADVDGGGDVELLVLGVEIIEEVFSSPIIRFQQNLRLLDGATGETAWSWDLIGSLVLAGMETYAFVGNQEMYLAALVAVAQDIVLSLEPMMDATGDGAGDVLVGSLDLVLADTYGPLFLPVDPLVPIPATGGASRFVAHTLDGGDGVEAAVAQAVSTGPIPWAAASPDLSGDGLADLVMSETIGAGTLKATSVSGEEHWRVPAPSGLPIVAGDLTGDGLADVLVAEGEEFYEGFALALSVYAGTDGSMIWSQQTIDTPFFFVTGTIDDDTGIDLTLAGWSYAEETDEYTLTIRALSGASGAQVWSRSDSAPASNGDVLLCFCPDDLTGDGASEMLLAVIEYTDDFGISGSVFGVNGRTGTTQWTLPVSSWDALPIPLGGDADGDGARDIYSLNLSVAGEPAQTDVTVDILSGADASTVWAVIDAGWSGYAYPTSIFGADLVGSEVSEVVLGLDVYDENTGESLTPIRAHGSAGLLWST